MGETDALQVFVGLAGNKAETGRRQVQSAYIDTMLDSKITVVTQRDGWEDHYRLFEALITGTMVITDKMLSLPGGYKNGTNIIECTSVDDLRSKVLYYLAHSDERIEIARQGRWLAMSRHRSWHRMEEIVFGVPLTICEQAKGGGSACPFIVHANEAIRRRYLRNASM